MELEAVDRENPDYQSFLLRLWRVKGTGPLAWRASLESTATGRRQGFADLEHLFAFLEAQTALRDSGGKDPQQQPGSCPGDTLGAGGSRPDAA